MLPVEVATLMVLVIMGMTGVVVDIRGTGHSDHFADATWLDSI